MGGLSISKPQLPVPEEREGPGERWATLRPHDATLVTLTAALPLSPRRPTPPPSPPQPASGPPPQGGPRQGRALARGSHYREEVSEREGKGCVHTLLMKTSGETRMALAPSLYVPLNRSKMAAPLPPRFPPNHNTAMGFCRFLKWKAEWA